MKRILIALAMVMAAAPAFAISSEELAIREYNKTSNSAYHDADDANLMKIGYTGASTEAIVGIEIDTMTLYEPYGTAALSYNMSVSSLDTLGELCDAIDAEDDYSCALIDGKRSDDSSLTTDITATVTTTDAKQAGGYYLVGIDSGSAVSDGSEEYMTRLGITPASGRKVVLKYCNVETDGTGTLTVYGKLAKYAGVSDGVTRNDSTLVIGSITTANDTAEPDGNIYGGNWLEFAKDEHVVISGANNTTDQSTTAFLECYWDEK